MLDDKGEFVECVSTHSRPKAAGWPASTGAGACVGFNSQPPEGGWCLCWPTRCARKRFNSQPPEGGWWHMRKHQAAALASFNSQPPEGGWL